MTIRWLKKKKGFMCVHDDGNNNKVRGYTVENFYQLEFNLRKRDRFFFLPTWNNKKKRDGLQPLRATKD